jgi:hypothetical protein
VAAGRVNAAGGAVNKTGRRLMMMNLKQVDYRLVETIKLALKYRNGTLHQKHDGSFVLVEVCPGFPPVTPVDRDTAWCLLEYTRVVVDDSCDRLGDSFQSYRWRGAPERARTAAIIKKARRNAAIEWARRATKPEGDLQ